MKKTLNLLLVFTLIGITAFAQKGSVSGTVSDKGNSETLIGVNVVVEGSSAGTVTNFDGEYKLDLEPGTYNISFSYITYTTQTITGVEVKAGQNTPLTILMEEQTTELKAVVVEARQVKNTENALINIQQRAPAVQDGISSEQISKLAAANAAQSVKSTTGASVVGGKYVYIRGLGDRYSNTQLNGSNVPSNDPYRNSFQLDLIPSYTIDNIIVQKTYTPDQPGNFTGGNINITTKSYPDKFYMKVGLQGSYNEQSSFNDKFLTHEGGKTDWLGFEDGSRDIPSVFLKPENRQQLQGSYYTEARTNSEVAHLGDAFTKGLNPNFVPDTTSSLMDHAITVASGGTMKLFKKDLGVNVGVRYSKNYDYYSQGSRNTYEIPLPNPNNPDEDLELPPLQAFKEDKSEEQPQIGGLAELTYRLNKNNQVKAIYIYNNVANKTSSYLFGQNLQSATTSEYTQSRGLRFTQRNFQFAQLKGEHNIEMLNNTLIEWAADKVVLSQDEPDIRFFANKLTIDADGDITGYRLDVNEISLPGHYYRHLKDDQWEGRLDITVPITKKRKNKIKFGGIGYQKQRNFSEDIIQMDENSGTPPFGPVKYNNNPDVYFGQDNIGLILDTAKANGDSIFIMGVFGSDATDEKFSYTGHENIYAGYVMGMFDVLPVLEVVAGVRVEQTDILVEPSRVDFWAVREDGDTVDQGSINQLDWLPSINVKYQIKEGMNLRLAASRTVARPNMRELAPFLSFDFLGGGYFYIGNPDLKKTEIINADLRWELYPRPGELFAVSAFYKNFTNPIARAFVSQSSPPTQITWVNIPEGQLFGAEIEFRKKLDFITPKMENFSIVTNFSYIESRLPLTDAEIQALETVETDVKKYRPFQGQSPYLANAMLSYKSDSIGLSANISYNISGPRLDIVGGAGLPDVYEKPFPTLNFNISKSLGKHVDLMIGADNLLNSKVRVVQTFRGKDFDITNYTIGRSYRFRLNFLIGK